MKSQSNSVIYIAVVWVVASNINENLVFATDKSGSPTFVVVKQDQIPTSGFTVVRTVTSKSTISCGDLCLQTTGPKCNGFMIGKTTCGEASNGDNGMSGSCELMSFTSLESVSFGSTQNACKRFYATGSLLSSESGQLLSPSIMGNISGTEKIYGLTAVNGQLFVTRAPKTSNQVSVYDTTTLKLVRNITVVGATGSLFGLAATPDNNYLYVADQTNSRLFKVNLSSSLAVANWTVASYPRTLSLNSLQNVIVAIDWSGNIREYASNGSLVRQVTLTSTPWHAVEVRKNLWAASFSLENQVALMAANGTILFKYGTSGSPFYPRCLGVDKQGYVFVADYSNSRVLVLNPSFTVAQPLRVTANATVEISPSMALHLDPLTGYLYVGEFASPFRVMVFDVSRVSALFYSP